ncbi:MAG: alanine racemase [Hyphomicrobiaceae bacterium]
MTTSPPNTVSDTTATGILEIDLGALLENYRLLSERAAPTECAAVVKADAYGHGDREVVQALLGADCRTFFVSGLREGQNVRQAADAATIYILDGLIPGKTEFYLHHDFRPVLGSLEEISEWTKQADAPSALHVDTGMNRLGLSPGELNQLDQSPDLKTKLNTTLLMSHFACADDPENPMNDRQQAAFEIAQKSFPGVPASLAASAATLTRPQSRFDMVRAGIALYGGRAVNGMAKPTRPVATLQGQVLQVRDNWNEATIGYGAAQSIAHTKRIATIAVGYADGITRHLSASDETPGGEVYCAGQCVPIIGRVSMDLITIDISSLPDEAAKRGDWVEIIGPNIDVDDAADRAGTIGYELLTQFGTRYLRRYIQPD